MPAKVARVAVLAAILSAPLAAQQAVPSRGVDRSLIQADNPQAVIDAISQVVDTARAGKP